MHGNISLKYPCATLLITELWPCERGRRWSNEGETGEKLGVCVSAKLIALLIHHILMIGFLTCLSVIQWKKSQKRGKPKCIHANVR